MAKGLRATSRKRNNAKLRATVFGPVSDARTERLSAKLRELAAKPCAAQDHKMDVDPTDTISGSANGEISHEKDQDDTDIDSGKRNSTTATPSHAQKRRPSRIEKKIAQRKAKSSIIFAPAAKIRQKKLMNAMKRKN